LYPGFRLLCERKKTERNFFIRGSLPKS
ncbi:unnamed protein product, partial [Arctia plantaginis]